MTNIITSTADFNGIELTIIHKDGARWLTAEQIGIALGFKDPQDAVNRLFRRNRQEFREDIDFTEIPTRGQIDRSGERSVWALLHGKLSINPASDKIRAFSPTGCMLLGFLARSQRAADFRVWARDTLLHQGRQIDLMVRKLLATHPHYRRIIALKGMMDEQGNTLTNAQIAAILGMGVSTLRKHLRDMEAMGLLPRPADYERYRAMAAHLPTVRNTTPTNRLH